MLDTLKNKLKDLPSLPDSMKNLPDLKELTDKIDLPDINIDEKMAQIREQIGAAGAAISGTVTVSDEPIYNLYTVVSAEGEKASIWRGPFENQEEAIVSSAIFRAAYETDVEGNKFMSVIYATANGTEENNES